MGDNDSLLAATLHTDRDKSPFLRTHLQPKQHQARVLSERQYKAVGNERAHTEMTPADETDVSYLGGTLD